MKKFWFMLFMLFTICSVAIAGGPPIYKVAATPPPPTVVQAAPSVMLPPLLPPRMKAFGEMLIYMSDYKAVLSQNGYPKLNFGESFGWSTKEAMTECTLGIKIPWIAEGGFTWITPAKRSGTGIPTVPLALGGYNFGPRLADTIVLSTKVSGERFELCTPMLFNSRRMMPAMMAEWWHMKIGVVGTPNTTSTTQPAVNVSQDFNKLVFGLGVSGETVQRPVSVKYKLLYALGGHTSGWLAQAGFSYKQNNLWAEAGWRYSVRTIGFPNGDLHFDTNGPFAMGGLVLVY
jgi:hypothetical protein